MNLLELIRIAQYAGPDKVYIAVESILVITIFVGVWGSYKHDKKYLLTCAFILTVNLIVGIFAQNFPYLSTGGSVLLIVLAVAQSELIRRSYH